MIPKMDICFEIVVILFKDGELRKISKKVPSLYKPVYRETGYNLAKDLIAKGWRVSSIYIENAEMIFPKIVTS